MRHHVAAGIPVVVLFALTSSSTARPQIHLEHYQVIVQDYRTGHQDRALAAVRTWSESNRQSLEETVVDLPRRPWRTGVEGLQFLLASGMLHSDAAVDAERTGADALLNFHLQAADRLLEAADRIKHAGFRPRWLVAMGLHLTKLTRIDAAEPFLDRACHAFPSDARLRLACGMTNATHGTLLRFTIPTRDEDRRGDPLKDGAVRRRAPVEQRNLLGERHAKLTAAARHFQQAIEADPSSSEARLRLAHIHTVTGRDRVAEPMLSALSAATLPRELAYTVRLLLGGIAERRGNLTAAADWYRSARQTLPGTQSALVALSYVLFSAGDRNGSQTVIDELLSVRLRPDDPWAWYPVTFLATPTESLDDLREEALR